ncbi:CASP8-associated protein 2 [Pygocentrus nattereri]|uniref:CASP8-associated protein 2 n=1 Tax=Pygocentrus nattereri TaxID=42514 RepID=A0A3B4C7R7_PYGNA|nr:CASP8-associated protein 2 [Pygocentrus nattereri]
MEESVLDELYEDLGQGRRDSSLNHDEDSVDIYSGLDDSPKGDGGNREVNSFLSPQRVKESMDLYEELITKEQEEKDATYNELKSKFDAAQNQVQELLAKLQQMQTKNSSLHKENTVLKKNISALIKTARMEIIRKDDEINKLNSRPGRGRFHQSWIERSHETCLRNQANTGPNVNGPNVNSPVNSSKGSQECRGGRRLAEALEHTDRSRLSSYPVHPVTLADASPSSVLQKCTRSNLDRPLHCQSKDANGSRDCQRVQSSGKERGNACSDSEILNSENCITAGQKVCDETAGTRMDSKEVDKECLTKQCNKQSMESNAKEKNTSEKTLCDVNKSERSQREVEKMNCASSKSQHQQQEDPVVLRRSGRAKSPFSQPHHVSPSKSHSQLSRGPSRVTSDTQTESRKQEQDRRSRSGAHSVSEMSSLEKSSVSLDRKMEKRGSREHHRKEERRHEDSERRRTRSDRSKEYEQKKIREGEGGNGQQGNSSSREERRSTRSETNKEHERRNAKEIEEGIARGAADKTDRRFRDGRDRSHDDVRNSRRESSPVRRGDQDSGRTRRKDCDEDINRRKFSSKREEQLSRSKASSSLEDSRNKSSDKHSVKEKCVEIDYDKGRRRADKDRQTLDRKSTKDIPAADIAKSAIPEKSRIVENGHVGETVYCQNEKVNMRPPLKLSSCDISAMAEESSPKRKLSFMETLNLTLSPIKKQSQSAIPKELIIQPSEDAHVNNSAEERGSFELGEEFCVIDETENSQVEAMDVDSASATDAVQLNQSNSGTKPSQSQDLIPGSEEPKTGLQDLVVKEKGLEYSSIGEVACEGVMTPAEKICIDFETQEKTSVTNTDYSGDSFEKCTDSSQCAADKTVIAKVSLPSERSVPGNSLSVHSVEDVCKKQDSHASVRKHEEDRSREDSSKECKPEQETPLTVQIDISQKKVSTSVKVHAVPEACSNADTSVSLEVVSSTVSIDVNPQSKHSCSDTQTTASDVEMMGGCENLDSCSRPSEGRLAGAVNTSSTLRAKGTPGEQASSSQPDSTEDELQISRPFNSVVVNQDEDSMMLTLSNIRVIPEAISPLTSPVRQMRKVQHSLLKEPHVKSPSKDLSTSASVTDKDTIKMDMNKENKRPDLSDMHSVVKDQQEVLSSTVEIEELEEGEIDSRSDEESSLIIQSPPHEKTKSVSRNQPSPRSPRLEKRTSQVRPTVTPTREQDRNLTAASKDSPTFNKRRFKTIAIPHKATVTTSAEFMNMLLYIRSELRRKYMKLHKNVTKSAFCCIVDMSLASFTEFVDGVNFHKFCSQGNEIKSRLNKIISSVMSKVSSNGIVNRIFEQRADDLKQKLWNFVDGQFDFLFKELKAAVKSASGLSKNTSFESKCLNSRVKESFSLDIHKVPAKKPLSTAEHRPNKKDKAGGQESKQWTTLHSLPGKIRGLGSRGKNIKATMEGETPVSEPSDQLPAVFTSEKSSQESVPAPENKISTYARRISQDRTDFEILTEQQTSSLTFNLVTDSQMGDIFRCLLQGSDLLEASVSAGENQNWPLNTPRKEGPAGESFIGVITPSKIITPSNLTWASISPYKFASPNNKIHMPLNPEVFDESCLLEIPSNTLPNQAASGLTTVSSHPPFSILAEDLAVSLTIPSPLKSDGHLSFLHPASGQPLSAPSSVISAHYSEDALLDGEDATEQDIHLSLDTDNSSCGSSTCQTCEDSSQPPVFQFKPNLPMQAEVMERSNDHFIVRIRHTSTATSEEPTQEQKEAQSTVESSAVCNEDKTLVLQASLDNGSCSTVQQVVTVSERTDAQMSIKDTSSKGVLEGNTLAILPKTTGAPAEQADDAAAHASCPPVATDSSVAFKEREDTSEINSTCERTHRKRKKRHSGPKAKRSRTEKHQDRHEKQRHRKRSKSCKEKDEKTPSKKGDKSPQESPGLSAKNVIRKKGEVVVTWTRDEDRDILIELKMKGASSKTFIALSTKLKKSPAQIEERFTQLMKLLKKKEKMEN